jgi:hypothetical protein
MASKAQGMTFEYSVDGGSTFTAVGSIVDLTVPTISKDAIEITNHGGNGYRDFTGGLIDGGETVVVVNYDARDTGAAGTAGHHDLRDLANTVFETTTNKTFKISFPDSDSDASVADELQFSFAGIVTGFEMATPVDGVLQATFTIKVSGTVTITDAV